MVASSIDEQHPQLPTTTTTESVVADVTIRAEVDEKEERSQSQEAHVNSTVDTVTNADVEMVKEKPSEKIEKSEGSEKQPQTTVISTTTHNLVDEASKLAEPIVVGESSSSTNLNSSSVEKVKGLTIYLYIFFNYS